MNTRLKELKEKLNKRYPYPFNNYPPCKHGHLNCSLSETDNACIDEICAEIWALEEERNERASV
jgi:hypothetical protein